MNKDKKEIIKYINKIIEFRRKNIGGDPGAIYVGDITFTIDNLKIHLTLELIEKTSIEKSHTRIINWEEIDTGLINKKNIKTLFSKKIWPIISKIINICDNYFNSLLLKTDDYPLNFSLDIFSESLVIPKNINLDSDDIKLLLSDNTNNFKIFDASFINSLDNFILKWKEKIQENTSEKDFQDFLFDNKRLFPIIFGLDDINNIYKNKFNKEMTLFELSENHTDISNDSFCIELKRPNTKIFTIGSSRNNIEGLSKELVSAANQLNLYLFKMDREKILNLFSFSKGVLIIGSNSAFENEKKELVKEKLLSWNLFRQNYKFEILTFDDVLKRAENLKESILNLSKKINLEECSELSKKEYKI